MGREYMSACRLLRAVFACVLRQPANVSLHRRISIAFVTSRQGSIYANRNTRSCQRFSGHLNRNGLHRRLASCLLLRHGWFGCRPKHIARVPRRDPGPRQRILRHPAGHSSGPQRADTAVCNCESEGKPKALLAADVSGTVILAYVQNSSNNLVDREDNLSGLGEGKQMV